MNGIQRIESRLLLAAQVIDNTLLVTGTESADTIDVRYNSAGTRVIAVVNGEELSFNPGTFRIVTIDCLGGADTAKATIRRKVNVLGGAGNDSITTGLGDDWIIGGDDDDLVSGNRGNDFVAGGKGADYLIGDFGVDSLFGGSGQDTILGGRSPDDLHDQLGDGPSGREIGEPSADLLFGDASTDNLFSIAGADTLDGGASDIDFAHFNDRSEGVHVSLDQVANDGAVGESGNVMNCEWIFGTPFADRIAGSRASDTISGLDGDDTIRGLGGSDSIFHGETSFQGRPVLDGGSGNDQIETSSAGATIRGQAGNDSLALNYESQLPYARNISAGSGEDSVILNVADPVQRPRATLDGQPNDGRGQDSDNIASDVEILEVSYPSVDGSAVGGVIDISGNDGRHTLIGGGGADTLIGGNGADLLEGGDGADSLDGGAGEDVLRGQGGRDTITGGPGTDSFNGGRGNETLNAADGEADVVNGAQGLGDSGEIDELLDMVIRVESTT